MTFKNKFKKYSWVLIVFMVSSCAVNDSNRTRLEGMGAGCLGGAALGGLIGGGLIEAAIGCAASSIAGLAVGDHIAQKKAQYANKEDYHKAMLAEADMALQQNREVNKDLKIKIAQLEEIQKSLQLQERKKSETQKKLITRQKEIKQLITKTKTNISEISTNIEIQKQVLVEERQSASANFINVSEQGISDLETEKDSLKQALAQLEVMDKRRAY